MASSVAAKRLFQEYKSLLTNPPDGITAGPVNEDDLFVWEALIQGPEGTPFEGGIFPAELKFPKDYPLNPPKMKFLGEIWHPNGTAWNLFFMAARTELTACSSVYEWRSLHIHPPPSWR
jgi:ubiquitin-conjugating enzyme E2 G2